LKLKYYWFKPENQTLLITR